MDTRTKKKHKVIERDAEGNLTLNLMKHQMAAYQSDKTIAGIVGSRSCGKTIYMSAEAFLAVTQGQRVLVMAQTYKALKINIFREIINRFREAGLKPSVNYSEMSIRYGDGELYGFTYEAIDSTRGMTEIALLLLDELAYAPSTLLSTVTPCLRGAGGSRIRFGTSPKKGSIWNKWFKDTNVPKDVFTATMFDNTELDEKDYQLQKDAIKDDMQYRQEILGEILDDDVEFGIIHHSDYPKYKKLRSGKVKLGIDCAGSGADYNVFVVADDTQILETIKLQVANTFQMFSTADELISKYNVKRVNIDTTGGFGTGTLDMLKLKYTGKRVDGQYVDTVEINGVNFGQKPNAERFVNARAEMYFNLVDKIRDEGFYVDDDEIREELQYITYDITSNGKTLLKPKSEIKQLIGRSPDKSDALALAMYSPEAEMAMTPQQSLDIAMQFCSI